MKQKTEDNNYPGKKVVEDGYQLVRELAAHKTTSSFLQAFLENSGRITAFIEAFQDIKDFHDHQTKNWDELLGIKTNFELNKAYLSAFETAKKAFDRAQEILISTEPFSMLKESSSLFRLVTEAETETFSRLRKELDENVEKVTRQIKKAFEGCKVDFDRVLAPLQELVESTRNTRVMAELENASLKVRSLADEIALGIKKEINNKEKESEDSETPPRQVKRIRMKDFVPIGKTFSTESDIDDFIEGLRQALKEEIKDKDLHLE